MAQSPIGASAGLSSAAREPSMEEILASIRRIIEESDTARPDDAPPSAVNSDMPTQTTSNLQLEDSLDSEGAELAPRQGIAVTPPVQKKPEPMFSPSLPDVASKPLETDMPEVEAPAEAIAPVPQALAVEELLVAEQVAEKQVAPSQPETRAHAHFSEPSSEAESAPTAKSPEPIAVDKFETNMEEEVSLDLAQALEPILSESTERQVSAAFEDLSFAVRSEQRRSFDEIAQGIMRPLLQDWLDNNLPTLVERLVREEIERVVRGGKR
ncbi:PopZ family protein [Phyllobacterium sp. K27]